jgi:hypothetical protein
MDKVSGMALATGESRQFYSELTTPTFIADESACANLEGSVCMSTLSRLESWYAPFVSA